MVKGRRRPKMSEENFYHMRNIFNHILYESSDEQAYLIVEALEDLCVREIDRLRKEMEMEDIIN